jgi:hypothetical protein
MVIRYGEVCEGVYAPGRDAGLAAVAGEDHGIVVFPSGSLIAVSSRLPRRARHVMCLPAGSGRIGGVAEAGSAGTGAGAAAVAAPVDAVAGEGVAAL